MPFLHHKRRDKASKDALTDQSRADDCNPQSHSEASFATAKNSQEKHFPNGILVMHNQAAQV
jgi:hypothetical protein